MFRVGILASGSGTNAQAIIDACEQGSIAAEVVLLCADRPCYAVERAQYHGIPTAMFPRKEIPGSPAVRNQLLCQGISKQLEVARVDCIVLAGFLSILDKDFITRWEGRVINIHPSLLPKFGGKGMYGMHVHKAVLEAGEKTSGCTVHLVNTGVDTGDILLQREVPVLSHDTPESLQKRVLEQEHPALVEGLTKLLERL